MGFLKFLHCADLHIDSPFKGISEIYPELKDKLYGSTFQSLTNIVNLAISKEVDFVVICGDIYDSVDKSLKAQLYFRNELSKLNEKGIKAFVVHGNHDPLSGWSASITWPDNVKIFGGETVEHVDLEFAGNILVRVYGISYKQRDISENLALQFNHHEPNVLAIALLHANIGNNSAHQLYAPASIEDLLSRGINYWALGHVHEREVLRELSPTIVYPGNTQARNPRETGAKGCYLVNMESDGSTSLEFFDTDLIRYEYRTVDISEVSDLDGFTALITAMCEQIANDVPNKMIILKMLITGRTIIHNELKVGANLDELIDSIQEQLLQNGTNVLINQTELGISSLYDISELRRGNDFVADIISLYDDIDNDESNHLNDIKRALEPLYHDSRIQRLLCELSEDEINDLTIKAMHQTLDEIVELD